MKILGISLDTYGDQVLRQPLVTALLDQGHHVTLAVRRDYVDIVPFIDERARAIACDGDPDESVVPDTVRSMLADRPDVVVAFAFNRREADRDILARAAGSRRIALVDVEGTAADTRGRPATVDAAVDFVEQRVPVDAISTERVKNAALLRAISGVVAPLPRPRLRRGDDDEARRCALLASLGLHDAPYVVMGGLRPNTVKSLPRRVAVETIAWLAREHGLATLLTGVEFEREMLADVSREAAAQGGRSAMYIGAKGQVVDLLALTAAARAYVGADTGTMHFAGALGVPVAALFGGGHFPRFEPAAERWFAVTKRILCFGCGWRCIYDAPRCIDEVSTSTWRQGIADLLGGQSPGWRVEPGSIPPDVGRATVRDARIMVSRYWQAATAAHDARTQAHHAQASADMLRETVEAMTRAAANVEKDRALRKEHIDRLTEHVRGLEEEMARIESDRSARLRAIEEMHEANEALRRNLDVVESDRAARLRVIEEMHEANEALRRNLDVVESDRAARLRVIETLDAANRELATRLDVVEADRAARLEVITKLDEELRRLRGEVSEDIRGVGADLRQ